MNFECNLSRGRYYLKISTDMRSFRAILAVCLSLAMFTSLALGNVGARMTMPEQKTAHAPHDCCKKKAPEQNQKKAPCDGSSCVMHCCRIILSQPDAVPQLSGSEPAPAVV